MTSHDEIISPPATDYPAPNLYAFVNHHAGEELREILCHTFQPMTHQFRKELFAKAPTDTNECAQAVDIWITRLNVIKSGLASFPMLIDGNGGSTTTQSLTIAPSAYGTTTHEGTTQVQQASPSQASITGCLERDQYQCIITGRKTPDAIGREVVPIIPFIFANHPSCRGLDFWKMLDMFYGSEVIDRVFAGLLGRVDSLENLITLDNSIHAMFNSGSLILTPETAMMDPIPVINDYTGDYWLDIDYQGLCFSECIQSTKGLSTGAIRTLCPGSRIAIACNAAMPGHASTIPLPSYFALRAFVLSLKIICADRPPPPDDLSFSGASSTTSPATPVGFENQYQTHSATSDSPCTDPALAASAILQTLVNAGALGQSP